MGNATAREPKAPWEQADVRHGVRGTAAGCRREHRGTVHGRDRQHKRNGHLFGGPRRGVHLASGSHPEQEPWGPSVPSHTLLSRVNGAAIPTTCQMGSTLQGGVPLCFVLP